MKRFFSCIMLGALLVSISPLSASEAFDSAVEAARTPADSSSKSKESSGAAKSGGTSSSSAGTTDLNAESEDPAFLLLQLLGILWLHNLTVRYAPYPYSFDGEKALVWDWHDELRDSEFKLHRLAVESSFVWMEELGAGNQTRFEGMFLPFLGLYAENLALCETHFNPDIEGNAGLALRLPVFQTNPLSLYFDAGAAIWYGNVHSILRKPAVLLGFEFRSYPFKPLTLRARLEAQGYKDDVDLTFLDLEIGWMFNRWEAFIASHTLSISNSEQDIQTGDLGSIACGARLYF